MFAADSMLSKVAVVIECAVFRAEIAKGFVDLFATCRWNT